MWISESIKSTCRPFPGIQRRAKKANAKEFLEQQAKELKIKPADVGQNVEVWKDLCHVMMNVKEFIYLK